MSLPIYGSKNGRNRLGEILVSALTTHRWKPQFANEIADMRVRMEEGSHSGNIKRGVGGTVDLEFLVQMMQLKHAATHPEVLVPRTLDAAVKLKELEILSPAEFERITTSYKMLRSIEARIRLLDLPGRHDLPEQIDRLAFLLHRNDPQQVIQEVADARASNRELFNQIIQRESQA